MREIILDETKLDSLDEVHDLFARELDLPDYYGRNASALWDCLGDVTQPVRIVVRRAADERWQIEGFDVIERVILRAGRLIDEVEAFSYVDDLDEDEIDENSELDAAMALERLKRGNEAFLDAHSNTGNISSELITSLFEDGQKPFATVICCSDSRVAPEHIFMTGLGELFVIRIAGNVIDQAALASAVYAAEHLHTKLMVVMGHSHCGAIESVMHGHTDGVEALAGPIAAAIGDERDPYAAAALNALAGVGTLTENERIEACIDDGMRVCAAVYHTHSGLVDFL